jgi:hypothetical protein
MATQEKKRGRPRKDAPKPVSPVSIAPYITAFNEQDKRIVEHEIHPEEWYSPNKVGFVKWINKSFHKLKDADVPAKATPKCDCNQDHCEMKVERFKPFPHQRFIRDYMQFKSPYRGLLLFHGLGIGKTCASIATAEMLINQKQVMVMLPASLRSNYVGEIQRCGHKYYTPRQYWQFVPFEEIKKSGAIISTGLVDETILKKNKGLWVPIEGRHTNFDKLSGVEQKQIVEQINHVINNRYQMINYNGFNRKSLQEFTQDGQINPFNNKVVIVDEVHNFISPLLGGGIIAKKLYDLLLNATNVKLVLLTGTPLINSPFEISYLINLIKGYEHVYVLPYKSELDAVAVEKLVKGFPRVQSAVVDTVIKVVKVQFYPHGFIENSRNGKVHYDARFALKNDHETLHELATTVAKSGLKLTLKYKTLYYTALPLKREEFTDLFIDNSSGTIKNEQLFMRRIIGAVSYAKAMDAELYPSIIADHEVTVPMSEYQLKTYLDVRDYERRKEETAKKYANKRQDNEDATVSVFKAFSRAICNFTFPESVKRPFPSKMKLLLDELDTDETEEAGIEQEAGVIDIKKEYQVALQLAMQTLAERSQDYLVKNLKNYSPKFDAIYKRMQSSPGTSLLYSQFRSVEGLGVFGLMLKAHGYVEFKVKKNKQGVFELDIAEEDIHKPKYMVFTNDKETTQVLLSIFNSDISTMPSGIRQKLEGVFGTEMNLRGKIAQLLMITKSGAEGISLKNVRQVHIMEPYWNPVRIDQAIGRAVRTCSHMALPPAERNVEVFRYISTFTAKQLKDNFTIRNKDQSETSDEAILRIAKRKQKINSSVLGLLKRAAVDCQLNSGKEQECFAYPVNLDDQANGVTVNIIDEPLDAVLEKQQNVEIIKPKKVKVKGVVYLYLETTRELFQYESYVRFGTLEHAGYLEQVPDAPGHYKLRLLKVK